MFYEFIFVMRTAWNTQYAVLVCSPLKTISLSGSPLALDLDEVYALDHDSNSHSSRFEPTLQGAKCCVMGS